MSYIGSWFGWKQSIFSEICPCEVQVCETWLWWLLRFLSKHRENNSKSVMEEVTPWFYILLRSVWTLSIPGEIGSWKITYFTLRSKIIRNHRAKQSETQNYIPLSLRFINYLLFCYAICNKELIKKYTIQVKEHLFKYFWSVVCSLIVRNAI